MREYWYIAVTISTACLALSVLFLHQPRTFGLVGMMGIHSQAYDPETDFTFLAIVIRTVFRK